MEGRTTTSYLGSLFSKKPEITEESILKEVNDFVIVDSEVSQALTAAYHAVPRVYTITNHPRETIHFAAFGCHGVADTKIAKQLMALMNEHAKENPYDFCLVLGDNFYDNGVTSPDDPRFQTQFYATHANPNYSNMAKVPYFAIVGNHDGNLHRWEKYISLLRTAPKGRELELNQVAHSYMKQEMDPDIAESKEKFYSRASLDYPFLPKLNMPFLYYSVIFGKLQIFFLNANSYATDYLAKIRAENGVPENNQAVWLEQEFIKANKEGRTTICAWHNPIYTCTKRAYADGADADLYLSPQELAELNLHFNQEKTTNSYNLLLSKMFTEQRINFDLILAAHDHAIYYYNNIHDPNAKFKLCQVISGGGGGDLQERKLFAEENNLKSYVKEHGYVSLTCDKNHPELIYIDIYTISGKHLRFTNQSSQPILADDQDVRIQIIRKAFLSVWNDYQKSLIPCASSFLGSFFYKDAYWPSTKDTEIMQNIINYLNQYHLEFVDVIKTLKQKTDLLSDEPKENEAEFSLRNQLKEIKLIDNRNIEELYTEFTQFELLRIYAIN